jgi:hypothetical protein
MLVERTSMSIAYALNARKMSAMVAALLLSTLSLGGCATSTAGSSLMDARAEAPASEKTSSDYPPVEVVPAARDQPVMTAAERSKLKKDLLALRDRQAAAAKSRGPAPEPIKLQ